MNRLAILLSLFLVACGGGGGVVPPVPPVPPVVNVDAFIEVRNLPKIAATFDQLLALHAIPIDLNGDGHDDLIFSLSSTIYAGKSVGNIICPNSLVALIYQSDGSFKDETSRYIPGSTDIGGCARKAQLVDVNSDGKLDILFAVNQEDRRLQANASDMNGPLAALISKGNIYEVKKFNIPSWYHSVGFGYDAQNKLFVTGSGYTNNPQASFKFDSDNNPIDTGLTLPPISPTTFKFFNINGTNTESKILLQASNSNMAYASIEGYIKNNNGAWDKLHDLEITPTIGHVNTINYTGENSGLQPVFSINGTAITFAGLSESCTMKMSPSSPQIAIFKIGGAEVPNFVDGMTVRQNDLKAYTALIGATVLNGVITTIPLNITREVHNNVNSNFFDCKDVNGDGYDDITVYPYNNTGMPYIYVNNKSGGFDYMGSKMFPSITDNWGISVSSLLNDFDKDGKVDLLVWPATGINEPSFTPHFFKGQAQLKSDW